MAYIRNRVQKEKLVNVQAILGKSDDPLLPPNALDAVPFMKTYHEIAEPIILLKHVRKAMHAGARLGIIVRNGKGHDHGLDRGVVIEEALTAGFTLVGDYDFLKYFSTFADCEATVGMFFRRQPCPSRHDADKCIHL